MGVLAEVVKLSIFFFLLFTATLSYETAATQLYEQQGHPGIGNMGILTVYCSFMIGGLIAPFVGKRVNFKWLFVASSICVSLNLGTGLFFFYAGYGILQVMIVEIIAILSGISTAFIWVAQSAYIHLLCEQNGLQDQKGYFFGVFYGILSLSNLSSGLLTTFVLGYYSIAIYFWILFALGVPTILFSIFFLNDVKNSYRQPSDAVLLDGEETIVEAPVKLGPAILKVFKFYPRLKPFLASMGIVGVSMGFYTSTLHNILDLALPEDCSKEYKNMRTGFMFLILGLGKIAGGYLGGILSDKLSIQKVGVIALSAYYLAAIFSFFATIQHETVIPVMIAAFFWGFQQTYTQNWNTIVCSRTYRGALQAFVINRQFHSLTIVVYEAVLIAAKPSVGSILFILLLLGLFCLLSLPYIEVDEVKTGDGSYIIESKEPESAKHVEIQEVE